MDWFKRLSQVSPYNTNHPDRQLPTKSRRGPKVPEGYQVLDNPKMTQDDRRSRNNTIYNDIVKALEKQWAEEERVRGKVLTQQEKSLQLQQIINRLQQLDELTQNIHPATNWNE